jgi:ankyrin repeat protein
MLTSPVAKQLQLTLDAIKKLLAANTVALQNKDIAALKLPSNSLSAHVINSTSDAELIQIIKKINTRAIAAEMRFQDETYKNNFMHWCVLADRPKSFKLLLSKGVISMLEQSNAYALSPLQLAAVQGRTALFSSQFEQIPTFHESHAEFSDNGKKYTVNINELQLAIAFSQNDILKSIFTTFSSMHMHHSKIIQETAMKHIGNCLHFLSYVSLTLLGEENAETIEQLQQTMTLLLSQPIFGSKKILEMLLNETYSNYEDLTPIAVAAKYGQKAWVNALKPLYNDCGLNQCVEEAERLLTAFAADAEQSKPQNYSASMWKPAASSSAEIESSSAPSASMNG